MITKIPPTDPAHNDDCARNPSTVLDFSIDRFYCGFDHGDPSLGIPTTSKWSPLYSNDVNSDKCDILAKQYM